MHYSNVKQKGKDQNKEKRFLRFTLIFSCIFFFISKSLASIFSYFTQLFMSFDK